MMKKAILSLMMLAGLSAVAEAQPVVEDAAVRKGRLSNGLTYYIRHNAKEAGLADFYIAQRVGSILEEPRQRGLAHFLEHMAFNGTEHFRGDSLSLGIVPWCESVGIKFGGNLNAYTSIDQTVYNISAVPVSREGILDSCLLILHDWSHSLLLEDREIDKERGVVHEEWRTRRAGVAMQRLMEQALPEIYRGTKYEDCLPIGSMDIVDHFPYQDLRDYYHKWYRPDLQAIIVVGDIDADQVERKLQALFGAIPAPSNPAERIYYPVGDNEQMIVTIQTDKEQPIVLAQLYMKRGATPDSVKQTEQYQRDDFLSWTVGYTLNGRLEEVQHQAEPPFLSASARDGQFSVSRTKDAFSLFVGCRQDNILGGLSAALAEVERVRQHGFTESELQRAKDFYVNRAESDYAEQNDRRNGTFVRQCLSNFLDGEPILSPEYELQLARKLAAEITLDELNAMAREIISNQNQVVALYAPEKEGVVVPSRQELEQAVLAVEQPDYLPYDEQQLPDALISQLPQPGTIVSEQPYRHGFTELTLSNGMRVYVKPTDFQSDDVQMRIKAEGGTSLYDDADIAQFPFISNAITEAGVGQLDAISLDKMLAGHIASARPYVADKEQGIRGSSSVKDVKTMLELTYLYFTQPRRDTVAFQSLMSRNRSFLAYRNASPKVDYNDSITAILYDHHPRYQPVTAEVVDRADYGRIFNIYQERFADASNFKAVFIGNISVDSLRPLLCQYLASLPSTYRHETTNWQRVAAIAGGQSVHRFTKPQATPLANVSIFVTADVPFSPQSDLELDFLRRVLQIAYTDSVREEKGGTYGVGVTADLDREDRPNAMLRISYSADPQRYAELNPIVYQQLRHLADRGPEASSMDKVKQYLLKQYSQMVITNGYWDYIIWHELDDDTDFDRDYCRMVNEMTAEKVQRMARRLLEAGRCIEVTMLSE